MIDTAQRALYLPISVGTAAVRRRPVAGGVGAGPARDAAERGRGRLPAALGPAAGRRPGRGRRRGPRSCCWIDGLLALTVPLAFLAGLLRSRLARGGLADLFRELRTMHRRSCRPRWRGCCTTRSSRSPTRPGRRLVDADGRRRRCPAAARPARSVTTVERDGRRSPPCLRQLAGRRPGAGRGGRRGGHARAGEPAAAGPGAGPPGRAAGLPGAHHHRGRRRAPAHRAQPARRRPAAPGHPGAAALAHPAPDPPRPGDAEQLVTSASDELARSLAELRELARGIHPAALDQGLPHRPRGAGAALRRARRGRLEPGPRCRSRSSSPPTSWRRRRWRTSAKYAQRLGGDRAGHAQAGPTPSSRSRDDGVGGADPAAGSGLRGLADRVEALGGRLPGGPSPPGGGTVVTAELPTA